MRKNLIKAQFIIFLIASVLFSLYSISDKEWVWENGASYKKILGTFSGLAAFTGVIAVIKFYKRDKKAYIYSIINALLFGLFALSINLTGDFLVNILWFIPVMIITLLKISKKKINIYRMNYRTWITSGVMLIVSFVVFYFLNPLFNNEWSKVLGNDFKYGYYFKYYEASRVLDSLINSISIIAIVLMIMGCKEAWYVWIPKNILSLVLYSGVGIVNVSVIAMNVIYLCITLYIIIVNKRQKTTHMAFVGPGAVGKTTIINYLSPLLEEKSFKIVQEREDFINKAFSDYMLDFKQYAFEAQKVFFQKRYDQIQRMQFEDRAIIDRHLIDDFIFPRVHVKLGNFTKEQANTWRRIEKRYFRKLNRIKKLDFLFIILSSDKTIEDRRSKRSAIEEERRTEVLNTEFFREVNKKYHDPESILYQSARQFAKHTYVFHNDSSKETSEEIAKIIKQYI